jgi:hypothetical protein
MENCNYITVNTNSMKVIAFCITDIRWWVKNKQVCLVYAINLCLLKAEHLRALNTKKKLNYSVHSLNITDVMVQIVVSCNLQIKTMLPRVNTKL